MQVHYEIDKLPPFRNAVLTIGTFDGVHMGHRQIIEKLKAEASKIEGETVIITFHPHPRKIVSSAILGIRLINTLEEKIELLRSMGIDHLVVVPFTDAFANQLANEYIENFLIQRFHPHTIIIGYDHRFGRNREGDYKLLEEKAGEYNYQLQEIPKHILEDIAISSTNIRQAILNRDIITANKLLGYDFFFSGEVVHGDKLGRKLGYPTANLKILDDEKIIPGDGIYAVYVFTGNQKSAIEKKGNTTTHITTKYLSGGMMSIGFRPTVDGKKRVIEVNIFDFNEEIYGQTVKVFVKQYLREEVKFNNVEELVAQMGIDKKNSLAIL
ncbi:MAG: bifunctional riboflavin kinase/FAD synthetase [Chitinophagaceae bacterium]|nr:bifunctional riboflavin kinase/FAD synthetase [Chitinophagaceae bacterium]MCB9056027.1 bifunctional riboflavin kinase/FAD synthetase [Chitinophagales bacterium]